MKRIIEHMAECSIERMTECSAVSLFSFTPHPLSLFYFSGGQSVKCTLEVISEGLVAQVCQAG